MSFQNPLFLIAGITLGVPVLIHLFNLRKYKTVLFPHTRFLRTIQLNSRKRSELKYKALLVTRLLFLALLILAFARPFLGSEDNSVTGKRVQFIYIDNSFSMSARKGARTMLEVARDAAIKQVRKAPQGSRFVLLTNDKPQSYKPEQADKVFKALQEVDFSAASATVGKVLSAAQTIVQQEGAVGADVFYYSDFQQHSITEVDAATTRNVRLYAVPVQPQSASNVFIDTAFLLSPVLQADKSNVLVVKTHAAGDKPKENPVLSLHINGQMKSAASLSYSDAEERTDTLSFSVSGAGWQQLSISVNDVAMRFDDTFRVAARSAPNLSILVLNEGQMNPYINAAFRAYNGFRINQVDGATLPADRRQYNLIILNGQTSISEALGKELAKALEDGQTICYFPGSTDNVDAINEGLKSIGDIKIAGIDTAKQMASQLQQGSPLVRDLFEKIPDNIQLPVANWHYVLSAGISANQQSVLAFRNGDPLLVRYAPARGQFYMCATSADLSAGNFPGSYFFTPFMYLMATQSGGGSVYAVTAGSTQPIFLGLANVTERNTLHATGRGIDVVPPQKPNGAGLDVVLGRVVQQSGFYSLYAAGADTTVVGVNQAKEESYTQYANQKMLEQRVKGAKINWMKLDDSGGMTGSGGVGNFPLWKVCVILAVIMLVAETYLLARRKKATA